MPELISILNLTSEQREEAERQAEKLSKISEFLSDAVEKITDSSVLDRIAEVFPWVGDAADVAGEALPPIKAAAKFLEKVTTINDPLALGMIACTAAYQQACIQAIWEIGRPAASIAFASGDAPRRAQRLVKEKLARLEARDPSVLAGFSLANLEAHLFTRTADEGFEEVASTFGYDEWEIRRLKLRIH
jgi:hypothetical protein